MSFDQLVRHYSSEPLEPLPTGMPRRGVVRGSIEAILFDVYGTLFISKAGDISIARKEAEQNTQAIKKLLEKFQIDRDVAVLQDEFFDEIERDKGEQRRRGFDYPEVVIEEVWKRVLKRDDEEIIRPFAMEYELIVNPVFPMPHAKELLSMCRRKNIPLGIISNAQFYTPYLFSGFMDATIEELGFRRDLVFFSYVFGYCKPSLFLFEKASENLRKAAISLKQTLYVGNDMLKDIYPAAVSGFQTVLFAGDSRSLRLREDDARCRDVTPDLVITDLLEILDYI
jgi:putative hydrolase of the HAD superfamily